MASRRDFLHSTAVTGALALIGAPLVGCGSAQARQSNIQRVAATRATGKAANSSADLPQTGGPNAAPDIFDAQGLDLEFWLRPRTLNVVRPASGEKARVLYWKDGEIIPSAYEQLCHLMRDVNGRETVPIDPKLFETLWGTQAFIARFGLEQPLEILSGYRTPASNAKLIEDGVPAARKSLHMEGRAADIRVPNLNPEILGGLIRSFRQGGVGFYYRASNNGGWIHADTGLQRVWKG
ncbi:DUF882 domain-containing protein [Massilia sp. TS11]|uniref:YcbK family protein n=1 Tax=Massilia sp. TS11 TaxID=2908003 RepID=UPI001EDC07E5|nr:DUF882 domain-containing protein [Massilia sp. TS11]MCG2584020.1 DUF882 domain-containing protein [Massilia sp. TS11]